MKVNQKWLEEIIVDSPLNQYSNEFMVKLKDMNLIVERVNELESYKDELRESYKIRYDKYVDIYEESQKYKQALEEIESLTRNPREYEPSIYTLHYIVNKALKGRE